MFLWSFLCAFFLFFFFESNRAQKKGSKSFFWFKQHLTKHHNILIETSGVFLLLTHFGLDSDSPPELLLSLCYSSVSISLHISADTCLSCDTRLLFLLVDGEIRCTTSPSYCKHYRNTWYVRKQSPIWTLIIDLILNMLDLSGLEITKSCSEPEDGRCGMSDTDSSGSESSSLLEEGTGRAEFRATALCQCHLVPRLQHSRRCGRESASVPVSTPLCSSCSHCHVSNERPPGGALCQRYYLLLWQLVCLEKEAIKMSLTEK